MKRIYLGIFFVFVLLNNLSIANGATVLGNAASSLAPNGWTSLKINTSGINGDLLASDEAGNYLSEFQNAMGWDPIGRNILFQGQAHGTTFQAECLRYSDDTDLWTLCPDAPGTPAAPAHNYGTNTVDQATGKLYMLNYGSKTVRRYSPTTNTWESLTPDIPMTGGNCCRTAEFVPALGLIVIDPDWGVWRGVPGTGSTITWSCLANSGVTGGNGCSGAAQMPGLTGSAQNVAAYSDIKQVVVACSGTACYKMTSAGVISAMATAPVSMNQQVAIFTADPVSGNFLAINGTTMYQLNPDASGSWSTVSTSVPGDIMAADGGMEVSISTYGVVGFLVYTGATNGTKFYLYKHSPTAPDTQAPTVPTGLTVTAISGTQINLSWTASTDNIGVTGYNIERCAGAACTTFIQVYIPTGTTQNDAGLIASTLYRYQVRAHDVAGNFSAYSTIQQATTQAGSGGGNFATRCAAAGVVKCWAFNQTADMGTATCDQCNVGNFRNGAFTCNTGANDLCPTIDVSAPGGPAMKFVIPSQSDSGASGSWYGNFSTDHSQLFGANQTIWYQFRMYITSELVTTNYTGSGGFKLSSLGTGDAPSASTNCLPGTNPSSQGSRFVSAGGVCIYSSCNALDIPMQNVSQRGFPQAYHSCFGSSSNGGTPYRPWELNFFNNQLGFSDISFQQRPNPYCSYLRVTGQGGAPAGSQFPPTGNCVAFFPGEWVTYTTQLQLGPRGSNGVAGASPNDEFVNSVANVYVTRDGGVREQIYNHTLHISAGSSADNQRFGKVWLLVYQTGKDPSQVTPVAYAWYKELIVSTQNIADPAATPTSKPGLAARRRVL